MKKGVKEETQINMGGDHAASTDALCPSFPADSLLLGTFDLSQHCVSTHYKDRLRGLQGHVLKEPAWPGAQLSWWSRHTARE